MERFAKIVNVYICIVEPKQQTKITQNWLFWIQNSNDCFMLHVPYFVYSGDVNQRGFIWKQKLISDIFEDQTQCYTYAI